MPLRRSVRGSRAVALCGLLLAQPLAAAPGSLLGVAAGPAPEHHGGLWQSVRHTAGSLLAKVLPDHVALAPRLPAYETLDPAALAAARARSPGLTVPQPVIRTPSGGPHEPVNLLVSGSLDALASALERRGWVKAVRLSTGSELRTAVSVVDRVTGLYHVLPVNDPSSPVSAMELDGRPFVAAFDKNDRKRSGGQAACGRSDAMTGLPNMCAVTHSVRNVWASLSCSLSV